MRMVALLCNASEVHIDADDVGCGCVSKNTYRKVHSIYVVVDGQTKNLKYDFSDVMYTLREFHISTKYVWWLSLKAIVQINLSGFAINDYLLLGRVAKLAPHSLNESLKRVIKVYFTQLSVYNQFIVFL